MEKTGTSGREDGSKLFWGRTFSKSVVAGGKTVQKTNIVIKICKNIRTRGFGCIPIVAEGWAGDQKDSGDGNGGRLNCAAKCVSTDSGGVPEEEKIRQDCKICIK